MRALRMIAAIVFLALAGLFGIAFYLRHVTNWDCFNSQGRCFDPATGTVILEQAGAVWLILSVLSLIASIMLIWSLKHRH
ncbi:MAG: hypothetical protein AAF641_07990 [Pseudomonadota bacterium]